ncbi:hypothetical protein BB561_000837 [Smittium simulii]|uniref:MSP domain-containing protein n=1 Tax=Smittium simulii TaxID=133385 RepID=A0A2T9YXE5_9FUNG|nr:hypothetical protein BB561_000837 [Smittium simulii]
MALQTVPEEYLFFQNPLNKVIETFLQLQNNNDSSVIFKIKTTAPKQYFVRPNSGFIKPGQSVEIQIGLQPIKDITPSYICKDKFLIQSWSKFEKEKKELIIQKKMRVKFEFSSDNSASKVSQEQGQDQEVPLKEDKEQKVESDIEQNLDAAIDKNITEKLVKKSEIPTSNIPISASETNTNIKPTIDPKSRDLPQIDQSDSSKDESPITPQSNIATSVNEPSTPKPTTPTDDKPSSANNTTNTSDDSILLLVDDLKGKTFEIQNLNKLIAEQKQKILQLESSNVNKDSRSFSTKTDSKQVKIPNLEYNGISIATAIFIALVSFLFGYIFS